MRLFRTSFPVLYLKLFPALLPTGPLIHFLTSQFFSLSTQTRANCSAGATPSMPNSERSPRRCNWTCPDTWSTTRWRARKSSIWPAEEPPAPFWMVRVIIYLEITWFRLWVLPRFYPYKFPEFCLSWKTSNLNFKIWSSKFPFGVSECTFRSSSVCWLIDPNYSTSA